ncbi:molybdopterin/thiamine biosynthesis adenylyltransferase [Croceifilum oryzae]|uniref:Molybdopterin/thiamine biosynthesis adenylyltransferase n=1 Tax=Croceifilum oryzae TaxID=1553429 RepID=A0AAJ1WTJ3_9BACL|nr:ThiF family adenylyltransferase [Croceifilum oryzae]MDQ0417056.1 molybdopterin/thiamine biosynthesis adenylyltransferase [Croceifilum oryzae]
MFQSFQNESDFYWELVKKNVGVYSEAEQLTLKEAKVVIFGLGGVGGVQAILCARMGIGHITGVDADEFEVSNMNRQMLASTSVLGEAKAKVAEKTVKDINPYISTRFVQTMVDEANVIELIKDHDVVIEAVDDMPSRVIIHRTARELGIPSVGMSGSPPNRGFVSSFFPDGVHYEDILNLPGKGVKLTDESVRQQIADIKKERARYSVEQGAPKEWAEQFCEGKAGWIITPVRAMLLATFSFHEAVQIITKRTPSVPAPKALLINLDAEQPVQIKTAPDGGWNYAHL